MCVESHTHISSGPSVLPFLNISMFYLFHNEKFTGITHLVKIVTNSDDISTIVVDLAQMCKWCSKASDMLCQSSKTWLNDPCERAKFSAFLFSQPWPCSSYDRVLIPKSFLFQPLPILQTTQIFTTYKTMTPRVRSKDRIWNTNRLYVRCEWWRGLFPRSVWGRISLIKILICEVQSRRLQEGLNRNVLIWLTSLWSIDRNTMISRLQAE